MMLSLKALVVFKDFIWAGIYRQLCGILIDIADLTDIEKPEKLKTISLKTTSIGPSFSDNSQKSGL